MQKQGSSLDAQQDLRTPAWSVHTSSQMKFGPLMACPVSPVRMGAAYTVVQKSCNKQKEVQRRNLDSKATFPWPLLRALIGQQHSWLV